MNSKSISKNLLENQNTKKAPIGKSAKKKKPQFGEKSAQQVATWVKVVSLKDGWRIKTL